MANNKITIKVTKVAYYKGALVYPNEIIKNYKGDVPSWATLANGKETPKNPTVTNNNTGDDAGKAGQGEQNENDKTGEANNAGDNQGEQNGQTGETAGEGEQGNEKSEAELQEELDKLLDEGIEKGVILEDAETKTIAQQIEEMKKLLGKE